MHTPTPHIELNDVEWSTVASALQDINACGCAATIDTPRKSVLGRVRTTLFGERRARGFADPRMEAIRRFACDSYRRRAPAQEHADRLAALGLSHAQIDAIALLSV